MYNSKKLFRCEAPAIAEKIAFENAIDRSIVGMNVKEARRMRLAELKEEAGTLKEVANRLIAHAPTKGNKKSAPKNTYLDRYLSQIFTGTRGMGHKMARRLEGAFNKREGWMDHVGASSAEVNELLRIWGRFPETEQRRILEELRIRLQVMQNKAILDPEQPHHALPKRPQ